MRKIAVLAFAAPAGATTPTDKPVVTIGIPTVHDGGGVSPDTWHTNVTVPVGGFNVHPAGTSM